MPRRVLKADCLKAPFLLQKTECALYNESGKDTAHMKMGICGDKTMETRNNDRKSAWMLVSSMLIFGTIGIFRRYISLSSPFLAFSRGMLGGVFLLAFRLLKHKHSAKQLPMRVRLWLIIAGAVMGINWMLLFEAYNRTTVPVATLCYYMQPTIVILLSPWFFRERITVKKAVCVALSVIGMALVSGVTGDGDPKAGSVQGILLGLGAAACYAAVVILNKKISGIDAYQKTTLQLFSAGAAMIPYLMMTEGFGREGFDMRTGILLLVVGVIHTGIAYVLYFGSMDGLRAQSVAILSYIDPVSALLFSAVFLKEPLSMAGIIGAVLIIGSALACEIEKE